MFAISCFILAGKIIEIDEKYPNFDEVSKISGYYNKEPIYTIERQII